MNLTRAQLLARNKELKQMIDYHQAQASDVVEFLSEVSDDVRASVHEVLESYHEQD